MIKLTRKTSAIAMAAVLSMVASPLAAAQLPAAPQRSALPGVAAWESDSVNVQDHRYRDYRHRRHHDRIDAGDVLAGVLILGTIAAVASAASKPKQPRNYPGTPTDYRGNPRNSGSQGIDRATDMCVREIERDVRVDGVDGVTRTGDGWRVTGSLYNGEGFSCEIGSDGRIDDISYGGRRDRQSSTDRQYDDDRYAQAWINKDTANPEKSAPAKPAYPGGPVPGDEGYGVDDGRYSTAS